MRGYLWEAVPGMTTWWVEAGTRPAKLEVERTGEQVGNAPCTMAIHDVVNIVKEGAIEDYPVALWAECQSPATISLGGHMATQMKQ